MSNDQIASLNSLDEPQTSAFVVTSVEDASFYKDARSYIHIKLVTHRGPVMLILLAAHLDALIRTLDAVESAVSLLDPARGPVAGEPCNVRTAFVDGYQIGNGVANEVPNVVMGLRSGESVRWFALDEQRATALQHDLAAEIPKLQIAPRAN